MLEDDLLVRCLREAFGMFPEGCTCEDNLDCRFCRCVVAVALGLLVSGRATCVERRSLAMKVLRSLFRRPRMRKFMSCGGCFAYEQRARAC
jgi:hypothetical protein